MLRKLVIAAIAAAVCLGVARAQDYPSRPIRLIVPFAAGGGTDTLSRIFGQVLSEQMKGTVLVENVGGAGGSIGTAQGAKAAPDGYTLLMSTGTHTINPSIFVKRPFDEVRDFTPIVIVSNSPNMIAVSVKLPVKSVSEFITYAKANPGKIQYGTGGHGTHQHMAVELFRVLAGINIAHVPYKGGVPAITDTMSGQIAMVSTSVPALQPYVKAGRVRAIAVTSAKRSSAMPDVPTIAEQGFPGFDVNYWLGLMGPAKLPPPVVRRINQETNAAVKLPEVREQFIFNGAEPGGGTPEEFLALVKREIKEWAEVVKKTGITPQ